MTDVTSATGVKGVTNAGNTAAPDDDTAASPSPLRPVAPARSFHNLPPVPESEVDISAIRAQGAGGQNVNKVSSAIHLRFTIAASSLPEQIKQRLLDLRDQRITKDGVIVIKSQVHR